MGPVGEAEGCRGPAVPVGAARHHVDLDIDACRPAHLGDRLAGVLLPAGAGNTVDTDLQAIGMTGLGQQLLGPRSEEHTSELQSLMRISYAGFCLKKKTD